MIVLVCLSQCQRAFAIDTAKSSPHADIRSLLNSGQANNAVAALQKILSANPQDAEAHNLLCRVHYQEQRWSDASKECQIAVQQDPNNSEFHDWLGRAYGEEAERASLLTAYGLAKKVHSEFEASVRLSPQNINGLCDLGEYSVEAPG
ncbi:MAG TPA: tetratricopeptide repeat protein, partial [Acidobacteriaceae bacterium]|nr:tetratricopeptide repeat protein [Acidobacteriaceae bacterium]